jgi:hypothetical protein
MSTTIAIVVVIALLVMGCGTLAQSYATVQIVKQARDRWRAADAALRRRILIGVGIELGCMAIFFTLVIVSPWGHLTLAYVACGYGVLLLITLPTYAAVKARQNLKSLARQLASTAVANRDWS